MTTKKAPTGGGQGKKSGVESFFSAIKAAFVNAMLIVARIGQAWGVR